MAYFKNIPPILIAENKRRSRETSSTSSKSSKISIDEINAVIEDMRNRRHRGTTKITYMNIWRAFNKFLIRLDRRPPSWEERLTLYVGYLIGKGAQSCTIRTYVSAIRSKLADDDYELKERKLLFSALTQACCLVNDVIKTRLPIQKGLLHLILSELDKIYDVERNQAYLALVFKCIIIIAYYGLLRISELVGIHAVKAKDVYCSWEDQKIKLVLYTSKTHGRNRRPQEIKITAEEESYDIRFHSPFQLITVFGQARGNYNTEDENFFIYHDHSPVKPSHVRRALNRAISRLGLSASLYGTHSMRIGRATDMLKFGMSIDDIKVVGRWRSNTVFKYIRAF